MFIIIQLSKFCLICLLLYIIPEGEPSGAKTRAVQRFVSLLQSNFVCKGVNHCTVRAIPPEGSPSEYIIFTFYYFRLSLRATNMRIVFFFKIGSHRFLKKMGQNYYENSILAKFLSIKNSDYMRLKGQTLSLISQNIENKLRKSDFNNSLFDKAQKWPILTL